MKYENLSVNELFNEYERLGIQKMKLIQKMNQMKHTDKRMYLENGLISFPRADGLLRYIKTTIRNKFYSKRSKHEGKITFKEMMENSEEWLSLLNSLVEARWALETAKSDYKKLKSQLDSVIDQMRHIRVLINNN